MPHRILVVDDEEAIRELLQEYLDGLGYEVAVAADGDEGIEALSMHRPHLVLIDFLLPRKNGFAVADAVRRSDQPHTPIVMMSGVFKNPTTAVEAKEKYDVFEFLSKPLDLANLSAVIAGALSGAPARLDGEVFAAAGRSSVGPSVDDPGGEIIDGVFHGRPFPLLAESGSLEQLPVALLLSALRYDRCTGMLDMTNESGTHRRIYIIEGNPTFMQSNAEGENVGALLLHRGRITEPDFDRCLRYMKDRGRTLQQSLLELRLVTEAGLATAYKLLAGQLLPLAVGMSSGTYRWRDSDAFIGRVPEGRFEPVQVLLEGIKKHVHPPQILKFFKGREDVPLVATTAFEGLRPTFDRVFGGLTVARLVDGERTYRQLSRAHSASAATVVPQLFALVTSGMAVLPEVNDDNAVEVAVNVAAAQVDSFDLSDSAIDVDLAQGGSSGGGTSSSADRNAQAAIERYHAEIMSMDFFQIFRASPETPEDDIKSAYFELAKRWHTDAFADRKLGAAQAKLEEIFARITEGYETITDPSQRSEYIVYLDRKAKGLPTDVNEILRGEQLFDQATAMINRRDYANAQQVLDEATRLNPDPIYFATLGWVTFKLDQRAPANLSRAVQLLKKAVQEQENLPVAYEYLGRIAWARGHHAEARKWWQRCLEWEPGNIEAARGLRMLASRQDKTTGNLFGKMFKK